MAATIEQNIIRHNTAYTNVFNGFEEYFRDNNLFKVIVRTGEYIEFTLAGFTFCIITTYSGDKSSFATSRVRSHYPSPDRSLNDIPELEFITTDGTNNTFRNSTMPKPIKDFVVTYHNKLTELIEPYIKPHTKD